MNIKKSILIRVRVAFLLVCLFACAIVYKVVYIQFLDGQKWKSISKERRIFYKPVLATRGNIYSDNGSILATSLPFYRVAFDPTVAKAEVFNSGVDSLALLLSRFYGDKSEEYYRRKMKNARHSGRRYIRMSSRQINYQDKKMMARWPIFREGKNRGGVIFEKVEKRFKPFGMLAERTIGFINEDKNGAGLEYSFNSSLTGTDGEALFERIAGGSKPIYDGTEVKPKHGYDIKTTLDINLQDVAENALYKALEKTNAEYGTVILMEVKTGEIKAIANLGKTKGGYIEDYNYAVGSQGRTEPGSTFKLASMMALFEHAPQIKLTDTIDTGNGTYRIKNTTMSDSHHGGFGKITVKEVFEKSSNIGVAKLMEQYFSNDQRAYVDYLHKFGLSSTLGFQMDGEARPYMKSPEDKNWYGTTLTSMAIGYELKLSPLQTLAFYNAVANNGVKIQPIIVKEISKEDNVIQSFQTRVLNEKVCSDETLKRLKEMLEGVVERGTARNISSPDYKVAGKTGTARKVKNGRYVREYSTSFVGYFPADNPKYSCIVIIDSPRGVNVYGGDVAAPVFKELADKVYARDLAMHKPMHARVVPNKDSMPQVPAGSFEDLSLICNRIGVSSHANNVEEDWVKVSPKRRSLNFDPNPVLQGQVPDVTGMTLRDALFILGNQHLEVRVEGVGKRVQRQSKTPGTDIDKDKTITITLS
ncbi:cell division protein FtsI (penicillin-binding protein 3) [Pontibacter ummariensis]|uniref:Cell division protein FtsI (Penicillin-binding protein 3) n=1 Tax=Pontibacter ummariensis TaxID=1610492 RepID=A0A239EVD8_9BACT|nr:penicillin-binding protein [Pontibacter ummariensis]PRY12723.1 cell division protein FtsI (penicillin-binding protein 3) [Pontibacter ummariensis]SNS48730.1 cell division protein FtsI (penicillin-binding protein 3) [Pontibacter ummariensis]